MKRRVLGLLSFGHLATDLAQGAIPALLPVFKAQFNLSYTGVGFIVLLANVSSSVIQPVFGALSDRFQMRWLMPLGVLASGVGIVLAVLAPHYTTMVAMVFLSGLGVAAFHPEGYRSAGLAAGPQRATGMSYFSVGGNIGYGFGPAAASVAMGLAGGVYGMTYMLAFSVPAAILLWQAIGARALSGLEAAWTPPPAPVGVRAAAPSKRAAGSRVVLSMLVLFTVLRSWVSSGTSSFIPLYFTGLRHADPRYSAMLVSVFLASGAAGTLVAGPVADRWGRRRLLILSTMILTPTLWMLPRASASSAVLLAVLSGMASVSTFAVVMVMAQELIPEKIGMISGLIIGFAIGMGGVGVTLLGAIADRWGLPRAMDVTALLPVGTMVIAWLLPPDRPVGNFVGRDRRTSMSTAESQA